MTDYGSTVHIVGTSFNDNSLDHLTEPGGIVITTTNEAKLTVLADGTPGQILSYTGDEVTNIGWINSASSSDPLYEDINETSAYDTAGPKSYANYAQLDYGKDVYAISMAATSEYPITYANYLPNAETLGTKLIITVIEMAANISYKLYIGKCVFASGGVGYLEMDSVGQGVNLVWTSRGWAVIGGGGASLQVI
jgi:hypothetical protein